MAVGNGTTYWRIVALFFLAISAWSGHDAASSSSEECISIEKYNESLQKIRSLELSLSTVRSIESDLNEARSNLQTVKTEKEVCDNASATLFQRTKELEEVKANLQSLFEKKAEEVESCKDADKMLSESSAALALCKSKIETTQQALTECHQTTKTAKQEAEAAQQKLREQEALFQTNTKNLRTDLEKLETKCRAEKEEAEAKLSATSKQLAKATTRLQRATQESYLYSFPQFKRTMAKVSAFNKAFVVFIASKIEPMLPPSLPYDARAYYSQATLTLVGLYKMHIEPHVKAVMVVTSPHVTTIRKLYAEHASEAVNQASQSLATIGLLAWREGKAQVQKYSDHAGDWFENNFILPLIKSHPAVQELIPATASDRFFAFMYLLAIMFINACLIRVLFSYGVKPLFKVAKYILLLPFRILCHACCRHKSKSGRRKKNAVGKETSKESRLPVSVKKDDKKDNLKKVALKKA